MLPEITLVVGRRSGGLVRRLIMTSDVCDWHMVPGAPGLQRLTKTWCAVEEEIFFTQCTRNDLLEATKNQSIQRRNAQCLSIPL